MQFKTLLNIESSQKHIRTLAFVALGISLVISLGAIFLSLNFAEKQREKIYVLENGNSLQLALSRDIKKSRPVQARYHLKLFHELFYTLDPDEKVIEQNMNKALYMCDESVRRMYLTLKEQGFYNQVIAENISQRITVDSIQVDFSTTPIKARCFARQEIIRSTKLTIRELVSTCYLREVSMTDHNPMGFLVENYQVVSNKDLASKKRFKK